MRPRYVHAITPLPLRPAVLCQQQSNPNPHAWTVRALLQALVGWIKDDVQPPPRGRGFGRHGGRHLGAGLAQLQDPGAVGQEEARRGGVGQPPGDRVDDRRVPGQCRDAESGRGVERYPFRFAALAASRHEHHGHIEKLLRVGSVRWTDHSVHDQQLPAGFHRAAAVGKDLGRALVIPIVDDVLHDVGVGHRDLLEEVAARDRAARRCAGPVKRSLRALDDVRKIEQDAARVITPAFEAQEEAGKVIAGNPVPGDRDERAFADEFSVRR